MIAWTLVVIAALSIALLPIPAVHATGVERHFRIEASTYQYSPDSISVNHGDHVTIDLVSTDVVHGMYVDDYGVSVTADPGQTARLSFVADRPGVFRLRCNAPCGALHPFMLGRLSVGPHWVLWRGAGLVPLAAIAALFPLAGSRLSPARPIRP